MIMLDLSDNNSVPLLSFEGTAYECGYNYIQEVKRRYPGYRRYLSQLQYWHRRKMPSSVNNLFENRAPYLLDLFAGAIDSCGNIDDIPDVLNDAGCCTSFSAAGTLTFDGKLISGQTKDTVKESKDLYIVLRLKINAGPTVLVLSYPGELLGYGMWSTGLTIFRNNLCYNESSPNGLTMEQWGMLALAGGSVERAVELALSCGLQGMGNCLISDVSGHSASVEFNAGGVAVIEPEQGIIVHANHAIGDKTKPFGKQCGLSTFDSYDRADRLRELLQTENGHLTAQKAMMFLADHKFYPRGICRHKLGEKVEVTTSALIAEPAKGQLHVVKGHPCCNWPVTYRF